AIAAQSRADHAVIGAQPVDDIAKIKTGRTKHPMYGDHNRAAAHVFIMQARACFRFSKGHGYFTAAGISLFAGALFGSRFSTSPNDTPITTRPMVPQMAYMRMLTP